MIISSVIMCRKNLDILACVCCTQWLCVLIYTIKSPFQCDPPIYSDQLSLDLTTISPFSEPILTLQVYKGNKNYHV